MVSVGTVSRRRRTKGRNSYRQCIKASLAISLLITTILWFNYLSGNNKKRRLEFVHITKTGGSAIEKIAAENNIMWGACHYMNITEVGCFNPDIPYIAPNYQSYAMTSPWHTPPKIIRSVASVNEPYTGADLFTVVRNPYSRIVSEYYCPWTGFRKEGIDNRETMNKWIIETVTTLEKTLADYNSKNPKYRPKEQRRNYNEDPKILAQKHFVNQAEYVFDNGIQIIDHVIHYENIEEEFNDLMQMYGLSFNLPNKETRGVNTRKKESKLTHVDLFPETIGVINKYASSDFKMFGYEMVDNFQKAGEYSLSASSKFIQINNAT